MAIVLDVSESITGDLKLQRATQVLVSIVEDLLDGDRISLVTVGGSVQVEFEHLIAAERRQDVLRLLQALQPSKTSGQGRHGGIVHESTDLLAGLEAAERVLESGSALGVTRAPGEPLRRVLFLSHGRTTTDCVVHAELLELVERMQRRGMLTSVFALGTDHERSLLPAIAEAGRGDFVNLDSPESLDVARAAVTQVVQPVATGLELWLTPLHGAEELRTHGHRRRGGRTKHDLAGLRSAEVVPLGTLRFFATLELLVDLRLPPLRAASDYLFYELAFTIGGAQAVLSGHARIDVLRTGVKAAAPHRSVGLFKQFSELVLRDGSASRAEEADVARRLRRLAAEAARAELGDPAFRCFGLAQRSLAALGRLH